MSMLWSCTWAQPEPPAYLRSPTAWPASGHEVAWTLTLPGDMIPGRVYDQLCFSSCAGTSDQSWWAHRDAQWNSRPAVQLLTQRSACRWESPAPAVMGREQKIVDSTAQSLSPMGLGTAATGNSACFHHLIRKAYHVRDWFYCGIKAHTILIHHAKCFLKCLLKTPSNGHDFTWKNDKNSSKFTQGKMTKFRFLY